MELRDFIKETIIQITDGIIEGNKYIVKNEFGSGVSDTKGKEVNFDIAVNTDEEEKSGVGGKISVASVFNLGADQEEISKSSNMNRIQFRIFLHIKTDKEQAYNSL